MNPTNVVFFGPRLWDPENPPDPPERDPATCLDCGAHYAADLPCCACHEPTRCAA